MLDESAFPNDSGDVGPSQSAQAPGTTFYDDSHPYYARRTAKGLTDELTQQITQIRSTRASAGLNSAIRRNWYAYYNLEDGKAQLDDGLLQDGDSGRRTKLRVNHYRALIRRVINLTTQSRPAIDVKAKNTDEQSAQQTTIARSIIQSYFDSDDAWRWFDKATEHAVVMKSGWVHIPFEEDLGEIFDALPSQDDPSAPPQIVKTGDFRFTNPVTFDLYYDHARQSWDDLNDITIREWTNKFDVAEKWNQVPDIQAKVLAQPNKKQEADSWRALPVLYFAQMESVEIEVFTYYHKRTPAMPQGRQTKFLADGTVLEDGPLKYKSPPLFRIAESDMIGTPQGHCTGDELRPIQEGFTAIASAIVSNQRTFGTQSILVPTGSNIQPESMNGGLGVVYYTPTGGPDGGAPKALQLCATPKEMFDHRSMLVADAEAISGINATSRGNPPPGLDAGVAINLVQADSITYQDQLRKSYTAAIRDACNHIIDTLRTRGNVPRMVQIVGKSNKEALKQFTGSDLTSVSKITVELGNPLEWTTGGRAQIAKGLVDAKMVRTPEEYLQVLNTGRIEPITEADLSEINMIRSENEMLMDWQPPPGWAPPPPPPPSPPGMPPLPQPPWPGVPPVMPGDNHQIHIKEHKALLDDPYIRMNAEYAQAVMKHLNDHADAWEAGDRILGIMQGMIPPGVLPAMAPPAPGGPPGPSGAARSPPSARPAAPGGPSQQSPDKPPPGILPNPSMPRPPPRGQAPA